VALGSLY